MPMRCWTGLLLPDRQRSHACTVARGMGTVRCSCGLSLTRCPNSSTSDLCSHRRAEKHLAPIGQNDVITRAGHGNQTFELSVNHIGKMLTSVCRFKIDLQGLDSRVNCKEN